MKGKFWVLSALILVTAGAYWFGGRERVTSRVAEEPTKSVDGITSLPKPSPAPATTATPIQGNEPTSATPSLAKTPAMSSPGQPMAAMENAPPPPPEPTPDMAKEATEAVALNIRHFSHRFGGNPVGSNAEIVKELMGRNSAGATYLPAELQQLNEQGELLDPWGTPYFFHQNAADSMEVRSAGPDKRHWTADDVVSR